MERAWIGGLFALLVALGLALPAAALDLEQARSQGLVGERVDGYVGAVPADPPPAVKALVKDVNAKRRERYAQIAREQAIPIEAVAAQAGQKLVDRAPSGQWVAGSDGRWRKK
jgi:uncharacterized protein YdbL (DUF1318 family)